MHFYKPDIHSNSHQCLQAGQAGVWYCHLHNSHLHMQMSNFRYTCKSPYQLFSLKLSIDV